MCCSSQSVASTGRRPQLVGQVESTSTSEKPFLSIWVWKAFLMASLALSTYLGLDTDTRAM